MIIYILSAIAIACFMRMLWLFIFEVILGDEPFKIVYRRPITNYHRLSFRVFISILITPVIIGIFHVLTQILLKFV